MEAARVFNPRSDRILTRSISGRLGCRVSVDHLIGHRICRLHSQLVLNSLLSLDALGYLLSRSLLGGRRNGALQSYQVVNHIDINCRVAQIRRGRQSRSRLKPYPAVIHTLADSTRTTIPLVLAAVLVVILARYVGICAINCRRRHGCRNSISISV